MVITFAGALRQVPIRIGIVMRGWRLYPRGPRVIRALGGSCNKNIL